MVRHGSFAAPTKPIGCSKCGTSCESWVVGGVGRCPQTLYVQNFGALKKHARFSSKPPLMACYATLRNLVDRRWHAGVVNNVGLEGAYLATLVWRSFNFQG